MKKKLLLLVFPYEFNNQKIEKYELEDYNEYKIIILDLSKLLFNIKRNNVLSDDKRIIKINSIGDLELQINLLKNKNFKKIVIFNFLYTYLSIKNIIILKKLNELKAINIAFFNSGAFNKYSYLNFDLIKLIIKCLYHLKMNILTLRKLLFLKNNNFKINFFLIGSKTEYLNVFIATKIFKIKIIKAHCWDISNLFRSTLKNKNILKNYGLFLDGAGPYYENDEKYSKKKNALTINKWYPALCLFFDFLELNQNKNIYIKSHPSVTHEFKPKIFQYRKTFNFNTIELIKNADFILTRNSTSLLYAVYFNKPLIILTSNEIKKDKVLYDRQIKLSKYLKCNLVNIDYLQCYKDFKMKKLNKEISNNYLFQFCTFLKIEKSNSVIIKNILK